MKVRKTNIILYVKDQMISRDFYAQVLQQQPALDVPGMTEFRISDEVTLGLMPEQGIYKLLKGQIADPALARGIARAELYLTVDDPAIWHSRATQAGSRELQPLLLMDWGDHAAYSSDPDGHVIVFASSTSR